MITKQLIEGLQIFQKYRNNQDGYDIGAGHDKIYIYATSSPLSVEDFERVVGLGFYQELSEDHPFDVSQYDPKEGWVAYP